MDQLATVFNTLWQIVLSLGDLVVGLLMLAMQWSLLIAWIAWWLCGVNWTKAWRALAHGAWAPVVLLALVSALVWSRIAPSDLSLGLVVVPSFWWHLGAVGSLICLTLLCGWVQGLLHWAPEEISIDPPAHDPSHGHAIGHH